MAERNPTKQKLTIPSHVPDDILFLTLSKLSVKSLLRFTSVSKSTNALIRDSTFIAAHHRYQIDNKNNAIDSYILYMPDDGENASQLCSLLRINVSTHEHVELCNLLLPLRDYNFVGNCEGLVCLTKDSNIYIWNPCVGTMKIVPPAQSSPVKGNVTYYFDFSYRSCDYRVIKQIRSGDLGSLYLEIYSMKMDSWKRIECNSEWIIFSAKANIFDGSIHWMGLSPESRTRINNLGFDLVGEKDERTGILRFDLEEEIFEGINDPSMELLDKWYVRFKKDPIPYKWACFLIRLSRSFIPRKFYFVTVTDTLMLFDQKDKNGNGFGTSFRAIGRQIKDD